MPIGEIRNSRIKKYDIIDHNFRQIQLQIQRQIENYKDKDKFKMPQTPIYFFAKEVTLGY